MNESSNLGLRFYCGHARSQLMDGRSYVPLVLWTAIACSVLGASHNTAIARSVWLSSTAGGRSSTVREYSIPTGAPLFSFAVPVSSIDGLAYDQRGSLWLLTEDGGRVMQYSRNGVLQRDVALAGVPDSLEGLAWFSGNLLIASPGGNLFIETNTDGDVIRTTPMGSTIDYAGMAASFGKVFAAGGGRLAELDPVTLSVIDVRLMSASPSTGLDFDGQFVWSNNENLMIARDVNTLDEVYSFPIPNELNEGVAVENIPEPASVLLLAVSGIMIVVTFRGWRFHGGGLLPANIPPI